MQAMFDKIEIPGKETLADVMTYIGRGLESCEKMNFWFIPDYALSGGLSGWLLPENVIEGDLATVQGLERTLRNVYGNPKRTIHNVDHRQCTGEYLFENEDVMVWHQLHSFKDLHRERVLPKCRIVTMQNKLDMDATSALMEKFLGEHKLALHDKRGVGEPKILLERRDGVYRGKSAYNMIDPLVREGCIYSDNKGYSPRRI